MDQDSDHCRRQQDSSRKIRRTLLHQAERVEREAFAHAVSPSAARSVTRSNSFDMFNLDMRDPAVHDALADLLWIPSPNKSIDASSTTKANLVSPSSESEDQLDEHMRNNGSVLSYNGEDEYYDKPDMR